MAPLHVQNPRPIVTRMLMTQGPGSRASPAGPPPQQASRPWAARYRIALPPGPMVQLLSTGEMSGRVLLITPVAG